jgi:hypothetical protein
VKNVGVDKLADLVSIVAPANETPVPGFPAPQHPLEAFQSPTGPQVICDPELGVRAAFQLWGGRVWAIVDLQDVLVAYNM